MPTEPSRIDRPDRPERGERPDRPESVPNPAVRRLSLYLRQLESFQRKNRRTISSKQLGESLGLTDAQVRKDLAYFGQFGHPGIGYRVDDLIAQVRRILGTDRTWNVLLVGAGNLGRALSAYKGFHAKGFQLIAVFDADPTKVGKRLGPFTIQNLTDMPAAVQVKGGRDEGPGYGPGDRYPRGVETAGNTTIRPADSIARSWRRMPVCRSRSAGPGSMASSPARIARRSR